MIHIDKDMATYIGFTALDGEENLYPQVKIHNISDTLIDTINLTHVADGKYRGTWTPDTVGYYGASCIIYTDSGYTIESDKYGHDGATYKVDEVETNVTNIVADTDELQTDWVNGGRLDTILDATSIESNVETHVTNSLNSYDPPTRTELTTDKNSIISEIDANETKIDTAITNIGNLNDVSTSDIQSSCDAAITANTMVVDMVSSVSFVRDIEGGRWHRVGNQMLFYKDDNATLVATFDLKKADGSAAGETDDVYRRNRV